MTRVAVATTSQLAADAASEIASYGGNAVDCALAAALLSMNTEPGVCAMAGSAYVTIWAPGADPVTIDGNTAIPGLGLHDDERGRGAVSVTMNYGGGITTLVGPGSVAVPGTLAAIERAWQLFGHARWQELFAPAITATRDGFPLSSACHYYLGYSGESVFGRSDDGFFSVHTSNRSLRDPGSLIVIPHLAETLSAIAADGARVFYEGPLAAAMTAHVRESGGALTAADLSQYEAIERPSLIVNVGPWCIASNPPPAIGGSVLAAMLLACADMPQQEWGSDSLLHLINVQRAVLNFRKHQLDLANDIGASAAQLLESARSGQLLAEWTSSSTVHTSAVDDDGMACAVTASSGYGSGEMPAGTGLWLNNCLGEIELNRRGLDAAPPGARLPSNMAPSVARHEGTVIAVGSPGADRITTALHQFFIHHLQMDLRLQDAIAHPRVHVDTSGGAERLMAEPGLDLPDVGIPVQITSRLSMYFGGVGAARFDSRSGFEVAADPRREGGITVANG
ncbi:MAG: gamma-glutamyltransferase [Proteobacteria bacterium]|nr:gamma-glutamyltransferase [Pseudomonadota bacterium]